MILDSGMDAVIDLLIAIGAAGVVIVGVIVFEIVLSSRK